MKVLKFGGSSMLEGFENVKKICAETAKNDGKVLVVVSAFKGVTDTLLSMGEAAEKGGAEKCHASFQELKKFHLQLIETFIQGGEEGQAANKVIEGHFHELQKLLDGCLLLRVMPPQIKDLILSFGERLSALILTGSLLSEGKNAGFVDARKLVKTNDRYGNAEVDFETTNDLIGKYFSETRHHISIVTGFIGSSEEGQTTTLGRGGSDYSAAILGAAIGADEVQIWKETNGVESADPRLVKGTKTVPHLSYEEAKELADGGAKVIYPPTMRPLEERNIPLRILNTFEPTHPGTTIDNTSNGGTAEVKAVTSVKDITIISVKGSGLHTGPGIAARVFESTATAGANVLMISQAVSENSICFAVPRNQAATAKLELEKSFYREVENGAVKIELEPDHVIIAAVGENMRGHAGVSSRLFSALNKSGVSAHMIAQGANELNISVAIPQADLRKALQVVHDQFILSDRKIINLYLVGPGRVGKEIFRRIQEQREAHLEKNGVEFRLAGVINSTRMLMTGNGGIPLEEWEQQLSEGDEANLQEFIDRLFENNLPHSILVDCTASDTPVAYYENLLRKSVAVVTPNKRALSGSMEQYEAIKKSAKSGNTVMGYETNVGAALPVIGPLREAIEGGDQILKIDGMLSGTLGYIFSAFDGTKPFSEVVREAYEKGYTEPNPADDLNLSDVVRKIVILARETGAGLEQGQVEVEPILSEACLQSKTVEEFFTELQKMDEHFLELYSISQQEGKRLRVIERFENGKASIQLMMVDPDHPAYHLKGSKNLVAYTTQDYEGSTWEVRGAGAGIGVTANGVLADVMKAARQS